jgi:small subunit ribosomal protein S24e
VIESIETKYGGGVSTGYAKVYDSEEAALEYESEHLLKRNGISKPVYKPAE